MTKKRVFVAALAICLIAVISMGTLAWFNDSESVENNFLFATTEDDTADEVFNVTLDEPSAPADKQYKDIEPGATLAKDPTVTNEGYYDQYIRVTVTVKNASQFVKHIMANDPAFDADVFAGFDSAKWIADADKGGYAGIHNATEDTRTYTFFYNGILAGEQTTAADKISSVALFTAVKIPTDLTREDVAELNAAAADGAATSFDISIKADAVQTENVGAVAGNTDAANAKIAFTTVGM